MAYPMHPCISSLIPSNGAVPSWSWAEGDLTLVVSASFRLLLGAVAAGRHEHVRGAEAPGTRAARCCGNSHHQ